MKRIKRSSFYWILLNPGAQSWRSSEWDPTNFAGDSQRTNPFAYYVSLRALAMELPIEVDIPTHPFYPLSRHCSISFFSSKSLSTKTKFSLIVLLQHYYRYCRRLCYLSSSRSSKSSYLLINFPDLHILQVTNVITMPLKRSNSAAPGRSALYLDVPWLASRRLWNTASTAMPATNSAPAMPTIIASNSMP